MRLLKVGSSQHCDIVLNSDYVSSFHAEITLLDNGDVIVTDKGSTNGTFVGKKKLEPNQDTPVKRGDLVRFGDTNLVWARVPVLDKLDKYKSVFNVGSNYRNDIILNSQLVSRYHASLRIDKKGKIFIHDNGSKNGTEVNGVKITPLKDYPIKRGDNVVVGGEDISENIKTLIPANKTKQILAWVAGIAVVALAGLGIYKAIGGSSINPKDYRSATTLVVAAYHYEISLEDDPLDLNIQLDYPNNKEEPTMFYTATAFFIDQQGRLATNRHVALPYDEKYRNPEETEKMRQMLHEWMADQLNVNMLNLDNQAEVVKAVNSLKATSLGRRLLNNCSSVTELNARIQRYRSSKVNIKGVIDYMAVGYAGHNYSSFDEFQRCVPVAISDDPDADVAILQLNDKKTPDHVTKVFDLNKSITKNLQPQKNVLYTIGYPNGLYWAKNKETQSIEPQIRKTECSKVPGVYNFEIQEATQGGSSGSPVFTNKGEIVGVVSRTPGVSFTEAVRVIYLKELFEKNIGSLNNSNGN